MSRKVERLLELRARYRAAAARPEFHPDELTEVEAVKARDLVFDDEDYCDRLADLLVAASTGELTAEEFKVGALDIMGCALDYQADQLTKARRAARGGGESEQPWKEQA